MLAPNETLCFVDIETASLRQKDPIIIQIAAVAVDSRLVELETFEAKIRFDESKASRESLDKNRFEPAVWKRIARWPEDAAAEFASFLRRHATVDKISKKRRPYQVAKLAAHNGEFDKTRLFNWYDRLGVFFPACPRVRCTLQRAMWLFDENPELTPPMNYQLATLCEYFGVPLDPNDAHDALADVRATVELYRGMRHVEHDLVLRAA